MIAKLIGAVNPRLSMLRQMMGHARPRGVGAGLRSLVRGNEVFLIPLALIAGLIAGALVTLMSEVAQLAHVVIYGIPIDVHLSANASVDPLIALTAPALGGLVLGVMEWLRRRWRISGAVDPIEANALRGGHLSLRDSVVVSGQTLISNGCGASVGLEAGYTQIGAGAASLIGRLLKLRRSDQRLMVGCGAAGAIAAAFGAPLTGAFYGCELIIGVYSVRSVAPVLTAAMSAALTARWLGGAPYLLEVPQIRTIAAEQHLALIVLALMVSLIGITVMRSATLVERIINRSGLPVWIRPAIGGVCVGGLALITPQVLAAGHGAMQTDLHLDMTWLSILTIIGLKLCCCLISLASGFRGGLFFASLFVGCLVGKLFALVVSLAIPGLTLDPIMSMLSGMATLAVAIVGGPLTMSFLVLEATRNLEATAGVLAACVVTSVFVRGVFGHSFSTWRLHLRGETIRSANDIGWLRNLTVERMMRTDVATVAATATISECRSDFPPGSRKAIFVTGDNGIYHGIVTLPDLFSSDLDAAADMMPIGALAKCRDAFLYRAMTVKTAMEGFDRAETEILAVLEGPADPSIVGMLSETYATRRYVEELDQAARGVLE